MTDIGVKPASNVPSKNIDSALREGETLAIFDRGFDTPFKGNINKIDRHKVYMTFYSKPPVYTRYIKKNRIKKIYKVNPMDGSLSKLIYIRPEAYFG